MVQKVGSGSRKKSYRIHDNACSPAVLARIIVRAEMSPWYSGRWLAWTAVGCSLWAWQCPCPSPPPTASSYERPPPGPGSPPSGRRRSKDIPYSIRFTQFCRFCGFCCNRGSGFTSCSGFGSDSGAGSSGRRRRSRRPWPGQRHYIISGVKNMFSYRFAKFSRSCGFGCNCSSGFSILGQCGLRIRNHFRFRIKIRFWIRIQFRILDYDEQKLGKFSAKQNFVSKIAVYLSLGLRELYRTHPR